MHKHKQMKQAVLHTISKLTDLPLRLVTFKGGKPFTKRGLPAAPTELLSASSLLSLSMNEYKFEYEAPPRDRNFASGFDGTIFMSEGGVDAMVMLMMANDDQEVIIVFLARQKANLPDNRRYLSRWAIFGV